MREVSTAERNEAIHTLKQDIKLKPGKPETDGGYALKQEWF